MIFNQSEFDVRCEWGENGVAQLAPISDTIIIVDVLCFSTSVEIATSNGAIIYPYRFRDDSAKTYAESLGAQLAGSGQSGAFSLSPSSLVNIPASTRLVLPSPNGATLSLRTGNTPTLAGCLRNARAVARAARKMGQRIAIIPAGERWLGGTLRPSFEDWIGAGAIIAHMTGNLSPESQSALAAFRHAEHDILPLLLACGSGKELIEKGFETDVHLAAKLDTSKSVPQLTNGAYLRA